MAAEWIAYLTAAKTALDLVKGLRSELPKGDKSDQIEKNIDDAERALKASEAELAKGLGYRICRCTFPPQIMLWREKEKANIYGQCGSRYPPKREPVATLTTPGPWNRR
jgi:hypothetical protein